MKILLSLLMLYLTQIATAAIVDRDYTISDGDGVEKIRIYNDGKNTIIDAIPGLVIRGATAEGERLIVEGIPAEVKGYLNGKPVTLSRFDIRKDPVSKGGNYQTERTKAVDALQLQISSLESTLRSEEAKYQAVRSGTTLGNDQLQPSDPAMTSYGLITIQDAINTLVPKDFKIMPTAEINLQAKVRYDKSKHWLDAFGQGLQKIGVVLTTNMYDKTATLTAYRTSFGDLLERVLPSDYKVFSDSSVNLSAMVRLDPTLQWPDALTKAASDAGASVTANLAQKAIILKPAQISQSK